MTIAIAAPRLKVLGVETFEQPLRWRRSLHSGAVEPDIGSQAMVRLQVRLDDGREGFGYAAEVLAAGWFDPNPLLTAAQNQHQLRKSIEIATEAYLGAPPSSGFDLFADNYRHQMRAGRDLGLPPLVASFGQALLDRAVMDALCRLVGASFWTAMRSNLAGMAPHPVIPDFARFDFTAFLAGLEPVRSIEAQHRVGLDQPIIASDQTPAMRLDDGLPETLDEVVAAYGQRCFKLTLSGDRKADVERLKKIASVLDPIAGSLHITLDGNEQFDDIEPVVALWSAIEAERSLAKLCAATLFIEQPIKRQAALRSVAPLAHHLPVSIDESDGDLDAFVRARSLGYGGVSSKACKGFYKSVLNLARCRIWNAAEGGSYFLSGEDSGTLPGVAMQQDLALVSLLGLGDVERDGHRLVAGFADRPEGEARQFLKAHPDLYEDEGGQVRLAIRAGAMAVDSLDCKGFGSVVVPDLSETPSMRPAEWPTAEPPGEATRPAS
ncbi:MAG: mandelate racemase [Pseudomonadota bacterium]|nr:mandelate racemase [Pseudomonadota bacterium]